MRFDTYEDFRRASLARLADAQELLQPPSLNPSASDASSRHTQGSAYLAGYAVECGLKAYLIAQHSPGSRKKPLGEIARRLNAGFDLLSAEGHSIALLLSLSDLEERTSERQRRLFGTIAISWSTDLRYGGRRGDPARERVLVGHCREIAEWIHRML